MESNNARSARWVFGVRDTLATRGIPRFPGNQAASEPPGFAPAPSCGLSEEGLRRRWERTPESVRVICRRYAIESFRTCNLPPVAVELLAMEWAYERLFPGPDRETGI